MLPTLPFEIWAHVASYLSNVELERLYSVNRALYEISMNARYKNLRVRYPNKLTISKLRRMRDTVSVSDRVQDLEIYCRILEVLWRSKSTRFRLLRNQFRHMIGLFSKDPAALTPKSIASVQKLLLRAINNMHGLRSVLFDLHPTDGLVERYLPMAGQIWSLLSGRVDSLSIRIQARHIDVLHPTFLDMHDIKHLSVSLQGIYEGEARGLADLINTASKSLESLRLQMFSISTSSLVYTMFTRLHRLSRLKRVSLSVYNTIGPDVAQFLNAHGENIEELKLSVRRTAGGAPFSIATLHLSSLRRLSVAWNPFNWGDNLNNPFQQIWGDADFPMLDCIEIRSPFMDVDHIALFCITFKRPGRNLVRHLELTCRTLNAESFDHLSDAFPNLHTLILSTIFLSNPNSSALSDWDIESFSAEMERREYSAWTLYDLKITPPSGPFGMPVHFLRPSYQVMRITASHIPSVRSFCGSGHMNVPEDAK